MVERLCTGSKEASHPPELLNPSLEDVYEGPGILPCVCQPRGRSKFKRDRVFFVLRSALFVR